MYEKNEAFLPTDTTNNICEAQILTVFRKHKHLESLSIKVFNDVHICKDKRINYFYIRRCS